MNTTFEAVIGLEIHIQLQTKSKAFSSDSIEYGALPNTQVSPISLGHPGTLPMHNRAAIDNAIKMGLALNCNIREVNRYARKNYFYADLPKGYQITQFDTPLCENGSVEIKLSDGRVKVVRLTRIHMEEDTGKSMHDQDLYDTLVDYNRAGTALIEVVTEPDIKTGEEAYAFVTEIRRLVRYLDICDGNMEEGSLRCDANISIMPVGSTVYGTKVEVKNMNSIRNVQRAIEFEINRQIESIEAGQALTQETRAFDALKGITVSLRTKEAANDYRYFPEPDLPPLRIHQEEIEHIKGQMPPLPRALFQKYTQELKLSEYDAYNLTDSKAIALYFENVIKHSSNYKGAANWIMGEVKSYLNEQGIEIESFPIEAERLAELINLISDGKISNTIAAQRIFPEMLNSKKGALELAKAMDLIQTSDNTLVETAIAQLLTSHPVEVDRYRNGEKQLIGFFMGQFMKISGGKIDPKTANQAIRNALES